MSDKVVDTPQLLDLIKDDERFSFNPTGIDPNGFHILHDVLAAENDQPTVRCMAYIKITNRETPFETRLNVAMSKFNKFPTVMEWKANIL